MMNARPLAGGPAYHRDRDIGSAEPPTFKQGTFIHETNPVTSQVVAQYCCGRLLGRGGFAKCYEVTDAKGNVYALKVINRSALNKPKTLQKLHSEISIHRRMKHKHVVNFIRDFKDRYFVYILLELCDNGTLMDMLKVRPFSVPETQYVMLQCLSGMQYLHDQCVIHRDLKPGNIMLDRNANVKIGDFGLAAELLYDGERKRTVCGTPNYIAPEIIDRKSIGHSYEVDTWSLGVILYTLLVGQPPFQMENVESTYSRIRACRYRFPSSVPESARDLITSILQSTPANRPTLIDIRTHTFFYQPVPPLHPPATFASFGIQLPETAEHSSAYTAAAAVSSRAALAETPYTRKDAMPAAQREILKPISANVAAASEKVSAPRLNGLAAHEPRRQPPPPAPANHLLAQPKPAAVEAMPPPTFLPSAAATRRTASRAAQAAHHRQPPPLEVPMKPAVARQGAGVPTDREDHQQLTALHEKLEQTLCGAAAHDAAGPEAKAAALLPAPAAWVTAYADFSSKYGLAYRLSTGHTGAHFNDSTKIVWEPLLGRVEYYARVKVEVPQANGETALFAKDELQTFAMQRPPDALEKKVTLINYFKSYLNRPDNPQNKVKVVRCSPYSPEAPPLLSDPHVGENFVYVKRWLRTPEAMVFRLSNKTVQVCFYDNAEVILSSEWRVVTYTSPSGQRRTLPLSSVAVESAEAAARLKATKGILYQLIKDHCL